MKVFGLIGYPLEHSFSKSFFKEKFQKEKIKNCIYENFELSTLNDFSKVLKENNPTGLNVTIPYKSEILSYCHFLSEEVKAIGAANTLRMNKGKMEAFNTDWIGFSESLKNIRFDKNRNALILGSGGASKAIQYALKSLGIGFTVVSRSPIDSQINYFDISKSSLDEVSLIVNCSPLGMHPDIESYPEIPYNFLNSNHFCYDLVYNPKRSVFLGKSEKNGAGTKNGLEMLILQAEEAWKIWQEII